MAIENSHPAPAEQADPSPGSLVDSLFTEFDQLPLLTVLAAVRTARYELDDTTDEGAAAVATSARALLLEICSESAIPTGRAAPP